MKNEKLNSMRNEAEIIASFGVATFANGKKSMKLESALNKIQNTTDKDIVTAALNQFRPAFNVFDKAVRGEAKKRFCAVCYDVVRRNGVLYYLNSGDGSINANRVLTSIKKSDDADLAQLIANFNGGAFDAYQAQKEAETREALLNAYCEAMQDDMNQYSIAAFLIA